MENGKSVNDNLISLIAKIGENEGVIYTGNPDILKKICPGIFGTIKPTGICMIGSKWKILKS